MYQVGEVLKTDEVVIQGSCSEVFCALYVVGYGKKINKDRLVRLYDRGD